MISLGLKHWEGDFNDSSDSSIHSGLKWKIWTMVGRIEIGLGEEL